MIYPVTLYNFGKVCRNSTTAGNVLRALCKQKVELTESERIVVDMIQNDSEWMNERVEQKREKERTRKAAFRASRNVPQCPKDNAGHDGTGRDTAMSRTLPPSLPPSLPSSLPPSKKNTNRSVTVPSEEQNGNGNGTGEVLFEGGIETAKKLARQFAAAAKKDQGAFFSGEWSATTVCLALTGDYKSANRWRQLERTKGEAAVIEECFAFWREIAAGEDVDDRGRALNARLAKLPDLPTKK